MDNTQFLAAVSKIIKNDEDGDFEDYEDILSDVKKTTSKFKRSMDKIEDLNGIKSVSICTLNYNRPFITADKILISIHRTAIIIWVIKIIRIAGAISSKQNCLRCKSLQRVGIISEAWKGLI